MASIAVKPTAKAETRFMPKAAPVWLSAALGRTLLLLYCNNMTTRYGGGSEPTTPNPGI
jgi:hypothetical protein